MKFRLILLGLFTAVFLVPPTFGAAHADTASKEAPAEPSAWKHRKFKLILGKGYTNQEGGQAFRGEYIYTAGPNQAGNVAMTCLNDSFMIVAATKDVSIEKNFTEAWMYPKKVWRQPTVTINGEQLEPNSWIYLKKRGVAIPQDRVLSLKIYNAAIRGDKIRVDFDNKRDFVLNLPKPNKDFAYFGGDCGMGRNK